MPVTLRDIAKHLNLSHATVSFVLNERYDVAIPEATRQRVMQAAKELGYRPNRAARALVSGRTQIMAVCVPILRHPFYMAVFGAIFEVLKQNGYDVLAFQLSGDLAPRTVDWPVDGAIVVDGAFFTLEGKLPDHMPAVSVGAFVDERVDHVSVDLYGGAQQAVRHLIDAGCRDIVYLTRTNAEFPPDPRSRAYDDVMRDAGLEPKRVAVQTNEAALVRTAVREFVSQGKVPDGFFCGNDLLALATLRSMSELGLMAPRDYLLVGHDGIEALEISVPSVSTVQQPIRAMAERAVELMLERLKAPQAPPQEVCLATSLVVRESSRRKP